MTSAIRENHASQPVVHRVQDALSGVAEKVSHVAERVTHAGSRVRRGTAEKLDDVGSLIARHPIAAVAVGLGIGYLIARIQRR